jgi:carotenoid cleavage dioxygenase-like enzyme
MSSNPPKYYEPGFRQNQQEHEIAKLHVTGEIPDWLEGSLIRNGPGMVSADISMRHWFDGLAMLHRFDIKGGEVGYKSKFLDCEAYRSVKTTGKINYSDFATDPCRSLFGKVQTVFESDPKITDSAKVNVGKVGENTYALGEPLMQIQIDPETLESMGVFHYGKKPGSRMTTAHPHTEGKNAYNLVVEYGPINYYSIYTMAPRPEKVASIPVKEPAYIHSFGMSDRYFIIAEYPLVVQSLKLVFRLRPFIENFKWKERNGSRFLIVDRQTGELVSKIKTSAFFSFHHVNAFEQGNDLVVDMNTYENADIIQGYYMNRLSQKEQKLPFGRIERFVIDVEKAVLKSRNIISEECIELPNFDYQNYNKRPDYRYVYGCGIKAEHQEGFYNQIVKIDVQTGDHLQWHLPDNYPGEPVFVPRPDRKTEDDGVLLSVVLDAYQQNSYLLILDAKNLKEMGRAALPHAVMFGYHGSFNN